MLDKGNVRTFNHGERSLVNRSLLAYCDVSMYRPTDWRCHRVALLDTLLRNTVKMSVTYLY